MTLRSCIPLFYRRTGWRLNVSRCVSLCIVLRTISLPLCLWAPARCLRMNMCEGVCGFSFCLPAPTAEKMATDVFFRDGSTIKEALVAFLMRHVNFIKCGVEESRSERLQPRKAKCLFAFNFDRAVFAPVYLTSPPLTPSSADQGRSRSTHNRKARRQAECVDVRARLGENRGGESRCWKIWRRRCGSSLNTDLGNGKMSQCIWNVLLRESVLARSSISLPTSGEQQLSCSVLSCSSGSSSAHCVLS